jgi:hypothetical protein
MQMSNSWSEMKKTLLTRAMSFIEKLVVPTPPSFPRPHPSLTPAHVYTSPANYACVLGGV